MQPLILGEPELRGQVIDCQKKLTRYLKDQVKTDGSVRDVCKSRVLESSLMLHLLTIQEIYPNCQYQLTHYLTTQLDKEHNNKFHKALIIGALRKSTPEDAQVVEDYMTGFQHFTASRKRMLFRAILAELGVMPYDSQYQIEHFFYRGYQSWVAAEICALKVLYAFGLNYRKWINHDDVEFLLATQNNNSIWEKHVLANIIILLALQKFPEHHHVVLKGINNLLSCQNSDGGWGHQLGDASDVISTSYTLIALSSLGDAETLRRGTHYLMLQQDEEGKFVSIPDQAAPRPIPYDVPILTSIFALLALKYTAAVIRE
ncbi:MAG: prenyltransferase/squalene oxidase repeat-containing protein [Nostoc sp.]